MASIAGFSSWWWGWRWRGLTFIQAGLEKCFISKLERGVVHVEISRLIILKRLINGDKILKIFKILKSLLQDTRSTDRCESLTFKWRILGISENLCHLFPASSTFGRESCTFKNWIFIISLFGGESWTFKKGIFGNSAFSGNWMWGSFE